MTGSDDHSDQTRRSADAGGLRYVNSDERGFARQRRGRGFSYRDLRDKAIHSQGQLQRIRRLAIPPAWTDVWICRDGKGHIQATGRDSRGRKQYRYHPDWHRVRDIDKFDRVAELIAALPSLRRQVRHDLKATGLQRDKVLAIVVAVLGQTLLRVGNDSYFRDNGSLGLTTLRDRDIRFPGGGQAILEFRGKSGVFQHARLDDARLVTLVRRCQRLPGQRLFQYLDAQDRRQPVDSDTVNDYLRRATGADFSAKDVRTLGATAAAFRLLASSTHPRPGGKTQRDQRAHQRELMQVENAVIAQVARLLGNTPAVCRNSYIHPAILSGWQRNALRRAAGHARGARQWEQALLKFLRQR